MFNLTQGANPFKIENPEVAMVLASCLIMGCKLSVVSCSCGECDTLGLIFEGHPSWSKMDEAVFLEWVKPHMGLLDKAFKKIDYEMGKKMEQRELKSEKCRWN